MINLAESHAPAEYAINRTETKDKTAQALSQSGMSGV